MKKILDMGYQKLLAALIWPQSLFLLGIRLVWGWGFYGTGHGKLVNLDRTIHFFTELGIPAPGVNAVMASMTEMVGGLLLLAGLCSRAVAAPLICVMGVAYLTAEREALLSLFTADNDKFFAAEPWPFMLACLIVLLFGPGRLSLDGIIVHFWNKKNQKDR